MFFIWLKFKALVCKPAAEVFLLLHAAPSEAGGKTAAVF